MFLDFIINFSKFKLVRLTKYALFDTLNHNFQSLFYIQFYFTFYRYLCVNASYELILLFGLRSSMLIKRSYPSSSSKSYEIAYFYLKFVFNGFSLENLEKKYAAFCP